MILQVEGYRVLPQGAGYVLQLEVPPHTAAGDWKHYHAGDIIPARWLTVGYPDSMGHALQILFQDAVRRSRSVDGIREAIEEWRRIAERIEAAAAAVASLTGHAEEGAPHARTHLEPGGV